MHDIAYSSIPCKLIATNCFNIRKTEKQQDHHWFCLEHNDHGMQHWNKKSSKLTLELWFQPNNTKLHYSRSNSNMKRKKKGTTGTGLLLVCLLVKCMNHPFLNSERDGENWIHVLSFTLSKYKILDFVLLTSPYPLPLFLPISPCSCSSSSLLIAAVWKNLQEKQLPQRKEQYYLLL